jgi:hypothetical protein
MYVWLCVADEMSDRQSSSHSGINQVMSRDASHDQHFLSVSSWIQATPIIIHDAWIEFLYASTK